jgi:hypothetical protein
MGDKSQQQIKKGKGQSSSQKQARDARKNPQQPVNTVTGKPMPY